MPSGTTAETMRLSPFPEAGLGEFFNGLILLEVEGNICVCVCVWCGQAGFLRNVHIPVHTDP